MVTKMSDINKYRPPKPSSGDIAHAIARAGLGAIPIAGAAASELLHAIVMPPLTRRRHEWMVDIGEALRALEGKMGIVLETLQNNNDFIDTAIEATRIAIKTSNREKRKALKNAILNSALPNPPKDSLQQIFLTFIDSLSLWHIKLLELFNDPKTYIEKHKISLETYSIAIKDLIEIAFKDLEGREDLYRYLWSDLYARGLIIQEHISEIVHPRDGKLNKSLLTEIGRLFLMYIKNPIDEEP
jgi:hypothetical protein